MSFNAEEMQEQTTGFITLGIKKNPPETQMPKILLEQGKWMTLLKHMFVYMI